MAGTGTTSPRPQERSAFSLTHGGLLFRCERRLGIAPVRARGVRRLTLALIGITWLPIMVLALAERAITGAWDPLVERTEVHVRLIVVFALLVLGERALEERAAAIAARLARGGLLAPESASRWRSTLAQVASLRDAWWPEASVLVAVYLAMVGSLLGVVPEWVLRWAAPAVHEVRLLQQPMSPAWWWYFLVGQPVLVLLAARWLWLWALWSGLLVRLSGLELRVQPAHADRAGGFGLLDEPLFAFRFFLLGLGVALASVWADMIAAGISVPASFADLFVAFLIASYALAFAPYLVLTPRLVAARRRGTLAFSALVRRYVSRFQARWIDAQGDGEPMLGHPDFQSLADIGHGFGVVREMRATVFDRTALAIHAAIAVAPFLAIVIWHNVSLIELLRAVFQRFLSAG